MARRRSSGEEIDDALDSCVGAVIRGFEPAGWLVAGVGAVVEAAMASGPQSRLWKKRNSRATWTPFWVRR